MVKTVDRTIITPYQRLVEENVSRFWSELGVEMHYSTEKTQLFTGIEHPFFNGILRSVMPLTVASKRVNDVIQQYKERSLPFRWLVSRKPKPGNLRTILVNHGLHHTHTLCGLVHTLDFFPQPYQTHEGVKFQQTTNHDTMDVWSETFSESMGIRLSEAKKYAKIFAENGSERYRHFIAYSEGKPVAVASLFFYAGTVGIYNLTVKGEMRGQGVASKLVSYLLNYAKKMKNSMVILYVFKAAKESLLRLGFEHATDFEVFECSKRG